MLGAAACTWPVSKRWLSNWGANEAERTRQWAGDQLVARTSDVATRGIDIGAPAATVWQWIVQLGVGRAGFYSYELLERMAGISVVNLESVEPAMQSLRVGDKVWLHQNVPPIEVSLLEPERHICFGPPTSSTDDSGADTPRRSWSLYVEPVTATSSRLVLRSCVEPARRRLDKLARAIEAPLDFTMEQRMLRTVKRLSEAGKA